MSHSCWHPAKALWKQNIFCNILTKNASVAALQQLLERAKSSSAFSVSCATIPLNVQFLFCSIILPNLRPHTVHLHCLISAYWLLANYSYPHLKLFHFVM